MPQKISGDSWSANETATNRFSSELKPILQNNNLPWKIYNWQSYIQIRQSERGHQANA